MSVHGSAEFQRIANQNTVLRGQVGSGLHGVTTGADDRDEMGVCIEPPEYVIGLDRFEQYIFRTQPEGVRSGAGDLDLTVYSLRKWARLAAQGNPTVLLLMFIPEQEIVVTSHVGRDLQAHPDRFLSRQVAHRFAGYLMSQRDQMLGVKSKKHTNRPELLDVYGFDTKFAYHMVRLGVQGVELLTTGRITLPMPEPERTWLTELRHGLHTKEEALERAADLLAQLNHLSLHADLPPEPDWARINRWLIDTYLAWWERGGRIVGRNSAAVCEIAG
ncbi:DNA polymerase beta superfamily protein [Nocardia farcinica]|uniref:DNA polymerase beta superfamily protein n=1 Tax=Nocardia farcinica TaxID=37329 RepID=UPI002457DE10|nr:nucleotidyltransferase domain-containing protein [Nocardia farcinica]